LRFSIALVLLAAAWHRRRGERREALAWLIVGLTTLVLFASMKPVFARPRPDLWPRLVEATGYSFPSGHALVSATFYPLLSWLTFRLRRTAFAIVGLGLPLFVGFGRLYLGVHWPSDVLAGWALGTLQALATIRFIRAGRTPRPLAILVLGLLVAAAGWRPDRAIRVATCSGREAWPVNTSSWCPPNGW
jgi:undecaprenyl-diphosphatase